MSDRFPLMLTRQEMVDLKDFMSYNRKSRIENFCKDSAFILSNGHVLTPALDPVKVQAFMQTIFDRIELGMEYLATYPNNLNLNK